MLLHPRQFLPDNLPMTRRSGAGPALMNDSYIITDDGRLRATNDPADVQAREFPTEPQKTKRLPSAAEYRS